MEQFLIEGWNPKSRQHEMGYYLKAKNGWIEFFPEWMFYEKYGNQPTGSGKNGQKNPAAGQQQPGPPGPKRPQ